MKIVIGQELNNIERREWDLWVMAIVLILVLGGITSGTYFFIFWDSEQVSAINRTIANRALGGFFILLFLFCAYVLHTRTSLARMRALAMQDDLTLLYNRRYFNDRIENEIARVERNKTLFGILLCDLDRFKTINDSEGHRFGDEVLISVAKRIRGATRETDIVFRWGGDEFLVIISDTTREGVLLAAERIQKAVSSVGHPSRENLGMSIGVVFYPEHGKNIDELLRLNDRALYIAKKSGNKIHIGMDEYHLNEDSVEVVFQKVVDTRNNSLQGYEALTRDPEGKLNVFALFKKFESIGKLTELKNICFRKQIKFAQHIQLERVFINVDFSLLNQLDPIPKPQGIDIVLEISELEALHDIDSQLEITRKWRNLGYKFAIDDFGAGFVSFPFMSRLCPEYIKVDRSAILQAVASETFKEFMNGQAIALKSISAIGIIAEGIETEKEMRVAMNLGIHLMQGFLFSKPERLLAS